MSSLCEYHLSDKVVHENSDNTDNRESDKYNFKELNPDILLHIYIKKKPFKRLFNSFPVCLKNGRAYGSAATQRPPLTGRGEGMICGWLSTNGRSPD